MESEERAFIRALYDLQVQLWEHQGDEIEALQRANQALQKSHEIIGKMLQLTNARLRGEHQS